MYTHTITLIMHNNLVLYKISEIHNLIDVKKIPTSMC